MLYNDFRSYISALEELGEVQRVEQEVDWDLEMGAIIRRSYEAKASAPFFQKIKGYPKGYTAFGAPLGLSKMPGQPFRRLALALGIDPQASISDILENFVDRKKRRLKPVVQSHGPCKENILIDDEANILKFPHPFLHEGDGGRYITWGITVTKDPDTGWTNWGMYRAMVYDSKTLVGNILRAQHIGLQYYQKYEPRGIPMEFAIAIGVDPLSCIMASAPIPAGTDEADIVGGFRDRPVEVVKCETADLNVPADAEIVIEGVVQPNARLDEGPFGEYTGYRSEGIQKKPVFHVKAITHRDDPILPISCVGQPVDDSTVIIPLVRAAEVLSDLRERNFPVEKVYCPPECAGYLTIVSTKVPYAKFAKQLANAIWANPAARTSFYLIVVENDIDVTNLSEVLWSLVTRCHPRRGIFKMPGTPGSALAPFLTRYERLNSIGSAVLFDCTWPREWAPDAVPQKVSFDTAWPKEIRDKVLRNWRKYGYTD